MDVSHSLGRTPRNVQATPTVGLGTGFWVSDVGSSSFRINLGSPRNFDATFYWRIE